MPHLFLDNELPGIRSLATFRHETGKHLYALAQILLHGESPLSKANRELIAGYVSGVNQCAFCCNSHAAASREHFGEKQGIVDDVLNQGYSEHLDPKINQLLKIAGKVALNGKEVKPADIDLARTLGANDAEIHDTVLIAATFCMFNRYVDGLATSTPTDENIYRDMGKKMAFVGYIPPQE